MDARSFEPIEFYSRNNGLISTVGGRIDLCCAAEGDRVAPYSDRIAVARPARRCNHAVDNSERTRPLMLTDPEIEAARAELHRKIRVAFCRAMHTSRLPTMTLLSLAAGAVGAIYKEVADQHFRAGSCSCGWQPNPPEDVEALQAALAATTEAAPCSDLSLVEVAGRA